MEASVLFGRLALTNSPIPASAPGSLARRADRDVRDVRRIAFLAGQFPGASLRRQAARIGRQLASERFEPALLHFVFPGNRSRGVAHLPIPCPALASLASFSGSAFAIALPGNPGASWAFPEAFGI
jgi:hypothetical protein